MSNFGTQNTQQKDYKNKTSGHVLTFYSSISSHIHGNKCACSIKKTHIFQLIHHFISNPHFPIYVLSQHGRITMFSQRPLFFARCRS